jgi:chorismate synthase
VGKIRLPSSIVTAAAEADEDNDEVEDALSPEFRNLLATVTREEVDKYPTRCPHPETSERMIQVRITFLSDRAFNASYVDAH